MVQQAKKATNDATLKNHLPEAIKNIGGEMMQGCSQMFTESVELSKEIMACRSSKDVIALQTKATQQLLASYFDRTSKLCAMVFDSYTDSLNSLNKRTEELQKAAA